MCAQTLQLAKLALNDRNNHDPDDIQELFRQAIIYPKGHTQHGKIGPPRLPVACAYLQPKEPSEVFNTGGPNRPAS